MNILKSIITILLGTAWVSQLCQAQQPTGNDTLYIKETQIPILIDRQDNVLFYLRYNTDKASTVEEISLVLGNETPLEEIQAVKLYYSGLEAIQDRGKGRIAPVEYISSTRPGHTRAANPSYSINWVSITPTSHHMTLKTNHPITAGANFLWVSIEMKSNANLHSKVTAEITGGKINGQTVPLQLLSPEGIKHRMGIGVRHAGDDGSDAYRIPGLVTTNKGTLLGVYDVRYNSSVDLQEHINIGLSRSTDGGKSWERMRLPIALGEYGGLPSAQNGVGDPAILVDNKTNTIWIAALWCHGMGNQRGWWSSQEGMSINETGQLVLSKSMDDGQTWTAPINITSEVKHPEWHLLLQGPGRGITMSDGTLVFPVQFIEKDRVPSAAIMYSQDRGESWHITDPARKNTTEAQVAEVAPGVLMLNMRDNRGGSRAVMTTTDLGQTWTDHPSSRKALIEPVCMASLISVPASDNCLNKDLLIFSNPNKTKGRDHMTIKISTDGGQTWPTAYQLLLDEESSWGYSCLTMIDRETIGILYEGSTAEMTFQSIPLKDIIK